MTRVYPVRSTKGSSAASNYLKEIKRHGDGPLRLCIRVFGLVQGVGFRPFVHRLAGRLGVSGTVRNTKGGVEIEAEGSTYQITELLAVLQGKSPPIAEIQQIDSSVLEPTGQSGFRIVESTDSSGETALMSPDVGTCDDCLLEMRDPDDRRYRYPFINCTNCGPRFTIVQAVPYDRKHTTMRGFELCPA